MIDLIERKKRGGALCEKEIRYFIDGFTGSLGFISAIHGKLLG